MISDFVTLLARYFPFLNNEVERSNWVEAKLKKIKKGETIIDLGAGECKYKKYCDHLSYTSQDNCEYDATMTVGLHAHGWDTSKIDIISDIIDIPVKNNSFDNVLCTEVFEHLPYPEKAVREIFRILKPNGKLIFTAPFCSLTHFAPYHYCTGFNIFWYEKIFPDYGLKITEIQRNGNYFAYLCQELTRLPLMMRRYTLFGRASYLCYPFLAPIILSIFLLSKIDNGSNTVLCFGYHIVAKKVEKNKQ